MRSCWNFFRRRNRNPEYRRVPTTPTATPAWRSRKPTRRELAKPRLASWQSESLTVISSLVKNHSKFDAEAQNASDLVNWLQAHHAPVAEKFPQTLMESQSIGCKKFFWNGEPVSVICFMRPDGGLIHLVVTNASVASDRARTGEPKLVQQGDWATATWREGNVVCMLALEGSRDQLHSYLL